MTQRIFSPAWNRWLLVASLSLAASALPVPGQAAEPKDRPERAIAVSTEYSEIAVPVGETVRMDLTVENRGRRDENVLLRLSQIPKGWKVAIKGGQFLVTGVPVAPEKSRVLTVSAEPDKGARPGAYSFEIQGSTADGALRVTRTLTVTLEERRGGATVELGISTSYPVLRGPTDSSFEFSLELSNKADGDRVVNVAAEAPKGWDVTIKPGYEAKQITSLKVRAGASERVTLELKPPREAQAGEYPILFRASTDRAQADSRLRVVLTGIYRLDATTPTGRLSLDAVAGRSASATFIVRNSGSAINRGVKLSSFAPENWKVEFSPERLEGLEPGALRPVEVKIVPAAQALVGDYSVTLTADGEKASKSVELRVTVSAPATWGWIGVGVIAAVIGGLGGLFAWFGRR